MTAKKEAPAEQIFIHASPEDLREFAKKLWAISEKADSQGQQQAQLSTAFGNDVELTAKVDGVANQQTLFTEFNICCKTK